MDTASHPIPELRKRRSPARGQIAEAILRLAEKRQAGRNAAIFSATTKAPSPTPWLPATSSARRTRNAVTDQINEQLALVESTGAGQGRDPAGVHQLDGDPIQPDSMTKMFARIVTRARIEPVSFHSLRHTHCTELLRAGVQPKIASERMARASIAIKYGHIQPRDPWVAGRCRPTHRRGVANRYSRELGWHSGGR